MLSRVGLLDDTYEDDDVVAWWMTGVTELRAGGTTYVAVADGTIVCRGLQLRPAMYAAIPGAALIGGDKRARALLVQHKRYHGMTAAGGPLEDTGRLRYIDGCSDTGL